MTKTFFISLIRNLWNHRATTAINILGLTLGLSCCLFLYVFLKYENTFDTHQPKADQIYRVNITQEYPNRTLKTGNTESMLVKSIRNEFPELEAIIQVIGPYDALLAIEPGTTKEKVFEEERTVLFADSLFLKYMDYEFMAGNPRTALDDPNAIVISTDLVEKYYFDYIGKERSLLGKEILLFDKFRTVITGVIDSPPSNTNFPFKALVSAEIYYKKNEWDRDNWSNISQGQTLVVLSPDQTPKEVESGFPAMVNKYRSEDDAKVISYSLLNLQKLHKTDQWGHYVGNYTMPGFIEIGFVVLGIFILLSACINFINLQTARSVNRAKEVGIKKILGSSRRHLIFHFLVATAIQTFIAFLFAMWIAEFMLHEWNGLLTIVKMDLQLDWSVVGIGFVLIMIVTLIAGLYPAFKVSSFQPSEALKSSFSLQSSKGGGAGVRQVLVVIQFIISQVLVIGTIVIAMQMNYFTNKDLGFSKERMLNVALFKPDDQQIARLVAGLEAIPEVSSFSLSSGPPIHDGYGTSFREVGHEYKGDIKTANKFIDHRYIDQFELKLIAGRNFRPDEYDGENDGFIVNETFVQLLETNNGQEAIGTKIKCYGKVAPIIGVVKDFHNTGLNHKIEPVIMFCWRRQIHGADISVSDDQIGEALNKLRPLWLEVFPKRTFFHRSVNQYIEDIYLVEQVMFKTVRLLAFIAIIIGCLGLYGLVSFMAIQKIKEIGVRKVLGATYLQILFIFSKRFFLLIIIAFMVACPLAYWSMDSWLSNYAYRIPLGWYIFLMGFMITLLLTVVTVGYISWRAARMNPADTLQYE